MRIKMMAGVASAALAAALLAPAGYADDSAAASVEAKRVVRDKASGELRAPTQAELQRMMAAEKAARRAKGEAEPAADPQPVEVIQHGGGMRSAVLGPDFLITIHGRRDANGKLVTSHSSAAHEHAATDTRPTE